MMLYSDPQALQVSGAHMQYGPVDVDDRDTIGEHLLLGFGAG